MSPARSHIVTPLIAAGLIAAGVSAPGFAGVTVGPTQQSSVAAKPQAGLDDLKAAFKRPPTIPFPADNPYTPEKAALGKALYYDSRISAGHVLSCSSCHNPSWGWGDGLAKGVGHEMKELGRRSPSIVNAAWGSIYMWDGRKPSLEEQALGPIQSDAEMHMPLPDLMKRLEAVPEYKPMFEAAFPGKGESPELIGKAIATYERTVVSGIAPFDRWIAGDEKAISDDAKKGFQLFTGKAACASCHVGWNFTDDSFQDIGLPGSDVGRGKFLPQVPKMQGAFKTPGLREIARRAPYMHDGSLPTLAAVVDHYDSGGVDRPSRSDLIKPLGLTPEEKSELVAFLETLTSSVDPTTLPPLPR
jgi:cytochrome c peroxidase